MQKETKIAIFLGVTIVGALLSGIMYLYIAYNLAANSVYYAKYIPHGENRHPQLEMVSDNLLWLDLPEVEGIRYDFDGHPAVRKKESKEFYEWGGKGYKRIYENIYMYKREDVFYIFDNKMKLVEVRKNREDETLENYNEQEIIQQIYTLVQPILDSQEEPSVNLQWIFNWKYKERFK